MDKITGHIKLVVLVLVCLLPCAAVAQRSEMNAQRHSGIVRGDNAEAVNLRHGADAQSADVPMPAQAAEAEAAENAEVSQCIDMTTLNASGTRCAVANHEYVRKDGYTSWFEWKWYENQTEDYGLTGNNRSYGVANILCTRQTVIKTAGKDYLQSSLSMLPPGKATSIRLGNPRAGGRGTPTSSDLTPYGYAVWHPQAEAVMFDIRVTSENSLLLFHYAAVMDRVYHPLTDENPNASPYFEVGIIGGSSTEMVEGTLLNKSTGYFCRSGDSDIDGRPEWKRFARSGYSNCYWKDWSVVAFDLSAYIGRTVRLRVENYDCVLASATTRNFTYCKDHFCYLYMYAECAKKELEVECLEGRKVQMTAPEGFNYSWYASNNPSKVLGTGRVLTIETDGKTTYYCRMSQKEDMTGSFVLEARPECNITKYIYETACEKDLPRYFNGKALTESGTYEHTVRLTSGLDSTTYYVLTVQRAVTAPVEYATFCEGTSYTWAGHGKRFASLTKPDVYRDTLRYPSGCDSLRCELHLEKQEQVRVTETHNLCKEYFDGGNGFKWHGVDISGFDDNGRQATGAASDGCDTLFTLELKTVETVVTHDTVVAGSYSDIKWHGYNINETLANLFATKGLSVSDGRCKEMFYLHTIITEMETEEVSCCNTELPLTWRGEKIRGMQDNGRQVLVKDQNGKVTKCYTLALTVNEASAKTIEETICYGEKYKFGDQWLDKEDVYTRKTTNSVGCDSVITLRLKVSEKPVEEVTNDGICVGESYVWEGHEKRYPELKEKGVYRDTVRYASGCDSARYTLNLSVYYPSYADIYDVICEGDSIVYFDTVLYTTGTCKRKTLNYAGCDSVITLHLTVNKPSLSEVTAYVCEGSYYTWPGHGVRFAHLTAGEYTDTLTNRHGCDSVVMLHLLKSDRIFVNRTEEICRGDNINLWDSVINKAGVYGHTFARQGQCDSVVTLTVNMLEPSSRVINATICKGESYPFFGKNIDKKGEYKDTLTNVAGCDSVVTLVLDVIDPSATALYDTICEGGKYDFFGQELKNKGEYTHKLKNMAGCDSVITLHLAVAKTYNRTLKASICEGGVCNIFSDTLLRKAGNYTRHYLTVAGCDSVVTVNLTVGSQIVYPFEDSFCEGGSYVFADSVIHDAGTYSHTFVRAGLCDSVAVLTLTLDSAHVDFDTLTLFPGESHKFGKYTLSAPGTWRDTVYEDGTHCMSISSLTVNVVEKDTTIRDTVVLCDGGTYNWEGHKGYDNLMASGLYVDSVLSKVRYELLLFISPPALEVRDRAVISSEQSYNWKEHAGFDNLTEGKLYFDTLRHVSGCDSVHFTLDLRIYDPVVEVEMAADTVCADDPAFALRLTTKSGKPVRADVLFGETAHRQRFRDTLGLAMSDDADETLFAVSLPAGRDSLDYVRPDLYDYSVRVTDVFGHETLFNDTLCVLYPSWVLVQRWNDVLMLSNDRYNGGYTFSSVRWYHNGRLIEGHGDNGTYIYQTPSLGMDEPYWAELTREDDGRTMRTCVFYPAPQTDFTVLQDMQVELAPHTPYNRRHISVTANCSGAYILYDVAGRNLGSGKFGVEYGAPDILLPSSVAEGTYLLTFRADDGRTVVRKWVVR